MTGYLNSTCLSTCLAHHGSCHSLTQLFEDRYGTLLNDLPYVNLLPLMVGMFWGAPLLAREHELGTDVLAWSQTVSRRRWLTVKLSALAAAAAVAATGFSLLFGWWFGPFADLAIHGGQSRIQPNIFDVQGIVPIAYTLFAFALGTAAGAVIRRTVPAMAVTVGGFLAARLGIQAFRGHMLRPLRSVHSLVGPTGDVSLGSPLVGAQNWVLQSDIVDHGGHVVSDQTVLQTCQAVVNPGGVVDCIASHGYRQVDIYQPLSRYWPLQGIESAVFVMLAMALLAATIYSVVGKHHHRHRHSVVSSAPTAHKHNLALTASASRRAQVRASTAV